MTYGWSVEENATNSIVAVVFPPGAVIKGEEDDDGYIENFTVPEGQIALMFQMHYVFKYKEQPERVQVYDLFFLHGTPKEIWNALGKGMSALPEA